MVFGPTTYFVDGEKLQDVSEGMSGFEDKSTCTIAWSDSDPDRTLTITGDHTIYLSGVRYSKATATIQIDDVAGFHYIYYDTSGNLTSSTSAWSILTDAPVACIYWNGTKGFMLEERHGIVMDKYTHEYLHETIGARYAYGMTGTFDGTSLEITAGEWHDEDLNHTFETQTTCAVMYRNASLDWQWTSAQAKCFHEVEDIIQYDNNGVLTNVPNNNYVAYWIFAVANATTPIISIMGQRIDNKLPDALENNTLANLDLADVPSPEIVLLYRVILRRSGTNESVVDTTDFRTASNLPVAHYVPTDHGTLAGLTDQDHPATAIYVDTSGFSGILSGVGETLMSVLEAIDSHTHS